MHLQLVSLLTLLLKSGLNVQLTSLLPSMVYDAEAGYASHMRLLSAGLSCRPGRSSSCQMG